MELRMELSAKIPKLAAKVCWNQHLEYRYDTHFIEIINVSTFQNVKISKCNKQDKKQQKYCCSTSVFCTKPFLSKIAHTF